MKRSVLIALLVLALFSGIGAAVNVDALRVPAAAAANVSTDYNQDPGSGGTEWRRTGEGVGCGWLMVAWEEFYYGTDYKTGRAECRWVWQ